MAHASAQRERIPNNKRLSWDQEELQESIKKREKTREIAKRHRIKSDLEQQGVNYRER